jgi:hypothetical protein
LKIFQIGCPFLLLRKGVLLIGDIVPDRDRRNGATFGSSKTGQVVIGEMVPLWDRRNEATS